MMNRIWLRLVMLAAGLTIGANAAGTTLTQPAPRYASTAQIDGQVYGGPSIRFYQQLDHTIAFDLDYGTGWRFAGNLSGETLQAGERLAAMYFDHYIYIFTTNGSTGVSYWKRDNPDTGFDQWSASWQPWVP